MMDHFYKSVPGWAAFKDLYKEMVARAPADRESNFVEIGSWLGKSASYIGVEIINSKKPIILHCIDPWMDGGPDLKDTKYVKELGGESPFRLFMKHTSPVAGVLRTYRGFSQSAGILDMFKEKSVDFIMIDGDHNYEPVKQDIALWLPKMREGSIMAGDDFLWPGVKQAVEESFKPEQIKTRVLRQHPNYLNSASYWWVEL